MALSLLLDENISPVVAQQIIAKRSDIRVMSLHNWRDGAFPGVEDNVVLLAAHAEGLTLVTYDVI